jgi:hypothetical protein
MNEIISQILQVFFIVRFSLRDYLNNKRNASYLGYFLNHLQCL